MNVKSVEGILVIISVAVSIIASGCSNGNNPVNKDNSNIESVTNNRRELIKRCISSYEESLSKDDDWVNVELDIKKCEKTAVEQKRRYRQYRKKYRN